MTSFISSHMGDVQPDEVRLLEETNVLQSCINIPPKRHNKVRPHPLSDLHDLRIQQGLIIKDLLFALLGYEGFYIRFSEKYEASNVDSNIKGPDFKIAKHLDISLKSITKKLVKYGKYYSGLNSFLEIYNYQKFGKVIQKLCFVISEFLLNYQQVILNIENEFKFNSTFNLNIFENILNQKVSNKLNHLYEIIILVHNETHERSKEKSKDVQFQDFITNVRSTLKTSGIIDTSVNSGNFEYCKGGLVLKIIQNRINAYKGDSLSLEFLSTLFDSVSIDYVAMLNKWLMNGEIDDPFDEFLVREKQVPLNFIEIFNSKSEHYWNELFVIRSDGLIDQFQSKEIQLKILNTGKFLNIFKICTGLENFQNLNEHLEPIDKIFSQDLELKINDFYNRANKLLMKLVFEGYNFRKLIDKFQTIFLFNQSFQVDNFLDKAFYELKRNRYSISVTRLQKFYDEIFHKNNKFHIRNSSPSRTIGDILNQNQKFSISSSNLYDIAKEIMNVQSFDTDKVLQNDPNFQTFLNKTFQRSYIKSADSNKTTFDPDHSNEYAISSVDLSIDLPFPLNLIINRELSYHYELMFKLQMMIKFISKFNDITWKEINYSSVWKYPGFEPRLKKWIIRCRMLHHRVRDFLNELQFYLNFDVIDTNYRKLNENIIKTEKILKEQELGSNINHSLNSTPRFKHSTLTNYNNNNNLFDAKIFYNPIKSKSASSFVDLNNLMSKLNEFLNTIINDSLITKPDLLSVLKNMFDIIISFNHYLTRLKKGLILCNEDLFTQFSKNYPDKFNDKSMDKKSINNRFINLSNSLKDHYEIFSDSLTEFIITLKSFGETENKHILLLSDRLEKCFPEN